jgi:micrococcal nuclease
LAYVIVNGNNINKQMIEDGYGWEYTYNLPYKYQSEFKEAQKTAELKNNGLRDPNVTG